MRVLTVPRLSAKLQAAKRINYEESTTSTAELDAMHYQSEFKDVRERPPETKDDIVNLLQVLEDKLREHEQQGRQDARHTVDGRHSCYGNEPAVQREALDAHTLPKILIEE